MTGCCGALGLVRFGPGRGCAAVKVPDLRIQTLRRYVGKAVLQGCHAPSDLLPVPPSEGSLSESWP